MSSYVIEGHLPACTVWSHFGRVCTKGACSVPAPSSSPYSLSSLHCAPSRALSSPPSISQYRATLSALCACVEHACRIRSREGEPCESERRTGHAQRISGWEEREAARTWAVGGEGGVGEGRGWAKEVVGVLRRRRYCTLCDGCGRAKVEAVNVSECVRRALRAASAVSRHRRSDTTAPLCAHAREDKTTDCQHRNEDVGIRTRT